MSAIHSAEFDDISVNLTEDDGRTASDNHRFVFKYFLVLNQ